MAGSSSDSSSTSSSSSSGEAQPQNAGGSDAQPSSPRPEFLDEVEDTQARQQVYLVALSALLSGRAESSTSAAADLQEPGSFNREQIRDAFWWAAANPVACAQRGGRPRTVKLQIQKIAAFQELHADGRIHYHVAVKFNVQTCFLPLKLALLEQLRLASHWSSKHTLLFSCITSDKLRAHIDVELLIRPCVVERAVFD